MSIVAEVLEKKEPLKNLFNLPGMKINSCTGKLAGGGRKGGNAINWNNTFSNSWDKGWGNYGK